MMKSARTTLPLALSSAVGLSAVTLMFVAPTSAEPLPTTYSANASGDLFHIDQLNLDMLEETDDVDLSLTRVDGLVSSTTTTRALAKAENVAGTSASGQSVRRGTSSSATKTSDTSSPVAGTAPAGAITGVVELDQATLSSRGRWVGDTSCLPATDRLTDSRAQSDGSNLVATEVPAEDGTITIPIVDIEIPLPDGVDPLPLPDPGLPPVDVPGLPEPTGTPTVLPTGLPTVTDIPTIPTEVPTTILPTLTEVPTIGLSRAARAPGDEVVMVDVAPGVIEQHTWLAEKSAAPDVRAVRAETIGAMLGPDQVAVSFFDGEIAVKMASQPRLTAYADGVNPGSVVWTPSALTLLVAGQPAPLIVPPDGTPVTVNHSGNRQVVVKVSAGQLTDKVEDTNGLKASGRASALHVTITRETADGPLEVLDADLLPMQVEAKSPTGGVECRVEAPVASKPGLTLAGKSNGKKPDKLTAKAISPASGAKATLYKVVKGTKKRVAGGRLNAKGDRVFKVKDRNGKKVTKYLVKIGKTELTLAGKASKKIR